MHRISVSGLVTDTALVHRISVFGLVIDTCLLYTSDAADES